MRMSQSRSSLKVRLIIICWSFSVLFTYVFHMPDHSLHYSRTCFTCQIIHCIIRVRVSHARSFTALFTYMFHMPDHSLHYSRTCFTCQIIHCIIHVRVSHARSFTALFTYVFHMPDHSLHYSRTCFTCCWQCPILFRTSDAKVYRPNNISSRYLPSYRYRQEKYRNFDISLSFRYRRNDVDVVYL